MYIKIRVQWTVHNMGSIILNNRQRYSNVLHKLKSLQSVHGESDADAITVVETSNNNRLYQSSHSSVLEVSSDAVYLPDVYVN